MRKTLLAPFLLLASTLAHSQTAAQPANTVVGNWRTPAGSILTIGPCDTSLCIRLIQIEASAPGTVDHYNPDPALRSRSLCDLVIGTAFHPGSNETTADGGRLYDPASGKTYSGALTMDNANTLRLRGYLGVKLFGRTEIWTRDTTPVTSCRR